MMICPNCSREIIEGAVFCGFCGTPVSKAVQLPIQLNPAAEVPKESGRIIEGIMESEKAIGLSEENRDKIGMPEVNEQIAAEPEKKKRSKGRAVLKLLLFLLLLISGGTLGYLAAEHEADIRSLFGETRMVWSESSDAYTEEVSAGNPEEEKEELSEEQKVTENAPEE